LRGERSRQILDKLVIFRAINPLDKFDFEAAAAVPKARIEGLADCPSWCGLRT